jgi:hypothetical protein
MLLAGMLTALYSCGRPEYLPADELQRYVLNKDNGLIKTVTSGSFEMQVTYRPTDLMVLQQVGTGQGRDASEKVRQARKKFGSYYYFVVRFSESGRDVVDPGARGLNGFSDLMQTISFRMAEYVRLSTPGDTVAVADYAYDRTYGMGQGTEVLFVFDRSKVVGQEWVELSVDEFGLGTGRQTVRFDVQDLENAPRIFR